MAAKAQIDQDRLAPNPPRAAERTPGSPHQKLAYLFLLALVVAMAAQMWTSIRQLSVTSDEIDHLHAGYRYLTCRDFGWNPEHPPLAKDVAALPLLITKVNDPVPGPCGMLNNKEVDFRAGHHFVFSNPEAMLTRARIAASVFALVLLITTWWFARSMFGVQVASVAALLIAFEPNLLGHGSLVTTDVPAALGILLAVCATYRYLRVPTLARLLLIGVATGFAFSLKHSTVILVFILPPLLLGDVILKQDRRGWRRAATAFASLVAIAAIAVGMLWASYGFRYAARPDGALLWTAMRASDAQGKVATVVVPALKRAQLLPEAYLGGLQDILVESELGRSSYLFGRHYWGGRRAYFPAAALVKLTAPMLLLCALSLLALPFWKKHPAELACLLWPLAVILAASILSGLNIGFRHVFPILPLLAIFAAAGSWAIAQRLQWAKWTLLLLLAWHVGSSLRAFPNYISYANEFFGGPANVYKYLADSNVDWGQAEKMAHDYLQARKPENCFFIRTFNRFNRDYGIPCGSISELEHQIPPRHFRGTLIVSSNVVAGIAPYVGGVRAGRVFQDRTPVAQLGGGALLVYEGAFDLTPIATEQELQEVKKVWLEDRYKGLAEIKKIAAADPSSSGAHIMLCDAYWLTGDFQDAEPECNLGLDLFYALPGYDPGTARQRESIMRANEIAIYREHR
jgi:hypothetical protein